MDIVRDDETLDDLNLNELKVIQKKKSFRFAIDAVLLAHFATIKNKDKIIDLGTGTGVIPLIMQTRAEDLKITGIEIQSQMAEMARRTLTFNKLNNIEIVESDLNLLDTSFNQQYNLVVSNPPYFPLNEGRISPLREVAIARHEIKCNLQQIVKTAKRLIKGKGRFALIHRAERLGEIINECYKVGLEPKRVQAIYPNLKSEANLVLVEALKDGGSGIKFLKPLIVYDEKGNYTKELLEIYNGGGR